MWSAGLGVWIKLTCQDGFVGFELLPSHIQSAVREAGAFPQVTQVIRQLALRNLQHVHVGLSRDVHRVLDNTYLTTHIISPIKPLGLVTQCDLLKSHHTVLLFIIAFFFLMHILCMLLCSQGWKSISQYGLFDLIKLIFAVRVKCGIYMCDLL